MTATSNRKPSPAQADFIRAIDRLGVTEVPAKRLFPPHGPCRVDSRTLRIVQEEGWVRFIDRPGRGRLWSVTVDGVDALARLENRCGRCGLTLKKCRAVNPAGHQSS